MKTGFLGVFYIFIIIFNNRGSKNSENSPYHKVVSFDPFFFHLFVIRITNYTEKMIFSTLYFHNIGYDNKNGKNVKKGWKNFAP